MELKKQVFIILVITIVATCFTTMEWTEFFRGIMKSTEDTAFPRRTKWFISLLCALLAWLCGKNAWNSDDSKRVGLIFVCTFLADTFLVLLSVFNSQIFTGIGILIFFGAHILLIRRNIYGLRKMISKWNIVTALVIAGITFTFITFVLFPLIKNEIILFIFGIFYMLILSVSAWAAWGSIRIDFLPRLNSIMTAIGLTCFYLCDISVIFNLAAGSTGATPPDLAFTIAGYPAWEGIRFMAHNWVWMFYTPALLLLAVSAYKTKLICYLKPRET